MLTSFFKKSKPINFIIVFFVTLLAFVIARIHLEFDTGNYIYVLKQIGLLFTIYMSIFLLNFIATKNSLTETNHYEILLFGLFLLFVPQTTSNSNVLFSAFFVLLGLRRVISLRSEKDVKKKIFDAAFWIAIASLFYFWSILFFLLIILSLVFYADNNPRHWIIPFLGVSSVFIISTVCSIIIYGDYFEIFDTSIAVSFDYSVYNSISFLIAITILVSFGIWSTFHYLQNIKKKKKSFRASFKTIVFAAIIGFAIVIIAPNKDGSEFLFLFMPLAVIIANYIEIIKDKWFKELFLGVFLVVPFVLLVL